MMLKKQILHAKLVSETSCEQLMQCSNKYRPDSRA